jgi:hypothetical protein
MITDTELHLMRYPLGRNICEDDMRNNLQVEPPNGPLNLSSVKKLLKKQRPLHGQG